MLKKESYFLERRMVNNKAQFISNEGCKTMIKRLSIDRLEESVKAFLIGIQVGNDQYLIEFEGKPLFGVVAPEKVERNERFAVYEKVWAKNKKAKAKEVEEDIAQALQATTGRKL